MEYYKQGTLMVIAFGRDILAEDLDEYLSESKAMLETIDESIAKLSLDLTDVNMLDSAGLTLLVRLLNNATELNLGFEVIEVSERAMKLFEISNLADKFDIKMQR